MRASSPDPAALDHAIQDALDSALRALDLESVDRDRFRIAGERGPFERAFGGQTLAQALRAAWATVSDKPANSLHAYFVETGVPGAPVEVDVDRVRDGRSFASRRVTVRQGDRTLLVMLASFHDNPPGPHLDSAPPSMPPPDEVPRLQDWIHDLPPGLEMMKEFWIDVPPPIELRIAEPTTFLGGPQVHGVRSHWMRVPRDLGADPAIHTALLVYASDYFLLDMACRSYPEPLTPGGYASVSLDHAVWLHRPVRFDRWHLHTQETVAVSGHRGLVRGSIHDIDGALVATTTQDVMIRPFG